MNFKSQKGYSLIEIGVGILIITVLLVSSTALFNGCFSIYHSIQQKNYVITHALSRIEALLQADANEVLPDPDDPQDLINTVNALKNDEDGGREKLADGEYYVPVDKVEGDFYDSPATNNMRITTKIRRVPTDGEYAYDNTVMKISVIVEYTIRPGKNFSEDEIFKYEISALKVTNS